MIYPVFAIAACLIAGVTLFAGCTQISALNLRQEEQTMYWSRYNTNLSGYYYNQTWVPAPDRASYGEFVGGGPGDGK
ncbi:hypothetical protein H6F88_32270 [Oculatella sp. FACHB-28]|uniref:hypothetical protein n=1 Tax=Cyanophyceae TaxID=3028117 RepID=UPI0016873885|nr:MULTISPECIES: hypothetical protein [Cyanophyceae]MBD1867881.1 hypothetical protein [Cyanobacteria bacterium FACHB-471]MBD1997362.1 hypothetical protein [Leptolyngbya sp. FACHB-541]MBD2060620.1 hypothetical protein [Oculatella sp. FACHB-28]MBD2068174.1 hypothetical protein [Leptolyngbya sp. FACHB-671]